MGAKIMVNIRERFKEYLKFSSTEKASFLEFCIMAIMITILITLVILVVVYAWNVGEIQLACRGIICR